MQHPGLPPPTRLCQCRAQLRPHVAGTSAAALRSCTCYTTATGATHVRHGHGASLAGQLARHGAGQVAAGLHAVQRRAHKRPAREVKGPAGGGQRGLQRVVVGGVGRLSLQRVPRSHWEAHPMASSFHCSSSPCSSACITPAACWHMLDSSLRCTASRRAPANSLERPPLILILHVLDAVQPPANGTKSGW